MRQVLNYLMEVSVADAMTREQLFALARLGAEARIAELQAEIEAIQRTFGIAGGGRRGRKTGRAAGARMVKPRRRTMSPEARKKISEAAKRRWAAYRAKRVKK
jgi:hypothetical protein